MKGVKANGNNYLANHIVICGGAWSSQLLDLLPKKDMILSDDIYPLKGQILLFEFQKHILLDELVPNILLAEDKYLVPRASNLLLVGASYENSGFDKSLNAKNSQALYEFALKYIPTLPQARLVKEWSGLRPATRSGKIHIKCLVSYKNLYINAGHFSNGINTALASAKKIVELVVFGNKHPLSQG